MDHKFNIGDKVKVYRAFEGYCGIGLVKDVNLAILYPVYKIELLSGSYLGNDVPYSCAVSEYDLKEIDRSENNK